MDIETPETLGSLIQRLRKGTGLNQDPFCLRCASLFPTVRGINQGALSRMERNDIQPSPEQLRAILATADATPADLSLAVSLLVGFQVTAHGDPQAVA